MMAIVILAPIAVLALLMAREHLEAALLADRDDETGEVGPARRGLSGRLPPTAGGGVGYGWSADRVRGRSVRRARGLRR
ncbi:hypothetical protein GCM10009780_65810 [Actinomadura alba]